MLLTRSIRRKMTVGLAVLLLTLGLLSIGGISGQSNYRRMVKDLDDSIHLAPRNADLVDAITALLGPLRTERLAADRQEEVYRLQRKKTETGLTQVRQVTYIHFEKLDRYFTELAAGPYSPGKVERQQQDFLGLRKIVDDLLEECERNLSPEIWDDPQQHQLAVAHLKEVYCLQRTKMEAGLAQVRKVTNIHFEKLDRYFAELSAGPYAPGKEARQQTDYLGLRDMIDDLLEECERNLSPGLWDDPQQHQQAVAHLITSISDFISSIREIPEPVNTMEYRLKNAKNDYRAYLTLLWVTSVTALVLFLMLAYSAYRGVVTPIRALHRGASRVAAGDFDYRIELNTKDEIFELATAFNHMTERFQSIAGDLDRQVKQQTQQLVQSAKLAGVGFLAAGVAHEINNPLHAISTAAEGLEYRLHDLLANADEQDTAIIREYLQMMQTESSRCRTITEKLLNFARGKDSERNQYDITAIVRDVVSMMKHVGKFRDRNIQFDIHDPHYAYVNGSEVKQVALNIIANAVEATQPGGDVSIGIRETPDFVEITCRDDGCGMTPDVLENLFEPFYTTKQSGKGTGLGLSISHRIIRDHDGVLEAASDGPGRGSTFRIQLPRKAKTSKSAA